MKRPQFKKGQKVTHLPTMEELVVISSLETTICSKVYVTCKKKCGEIKDYCMYYLEVR